MKYSKDEIKQDLRRVKGDSDTLKVVEYEEQGNIGRKTVTDRFGSWNQALREINAEISSKKGEVTEDDIIHDLQEISNKIGQPPTFQKYHEEGTHSPMTAVEKFGSWNEALRTAGVGVNQNNDVTKDEVLDDMNRVVLENNHRFSKRIYEEYGRYSSGLVKNMFGKWSKAVDQLDIEIEGTGQPKGSNSPTWNGGSSYEPYDTNFTNDLKEEVRDRDKRMCKLCEKPEQECVQEKLHVHHIDYDKKNTVKENLVSLCGSCHAKTNFNRRYWQQYFELVI